MTTSVVIQVVLKQHMDAFFPTLPFFKSSHTSTATPHLPCISYLRSIVSAHSQAHLLVLIVSVSCRVPDGETVSNKKPSSYPYTIFLLRKCLFQTKYAQSTSMCKHFNQNYIFYAKISFFLLSMNFYKKAEKMVIIF